MSTTGKTPVSHLNETLIRKGLQPIFSLKQSGVGTNQGLFVYEVTAGDSISAVGYGRSKKEAKQEAAKNALLQMKVGFEGPVTPELKDEEEGEGLANVEVISPYEALLKENAVGSLLELCALHDLPAPEYEQLREDGPPHAKHFLLACKVSSVQEIAVGRTKRQAKQLASFNMLKKLDELQLIELENKPTDKPSTVPVEELMNQFQETKPELGRHLLGLKIGQGLKHEWTPDQIASLQAHSSLCPNPMGTLEQMCADLGLELKEVPMVCNSPDCASVLLTVNTVPSNVFMGTGGTMVNAKNMAARNAVDFLQLMTKPTRKAT